MCLSLDFGDMGQIIVSEFVCFMLCWLLRSLSVFGALKIFWEMGGNSLKMSKEAGDNEAFYLFFFFHEVIKSKVSSRLDT